MSWRQPLSPIIGAKARRQAALRTLEEAQPETKFAPSELMHDLQVGETRVESGLAHRRTLRGVKLCDADRTKSILALADAYEIWACVGHATYFAMF
jgi:hypothetical protein